jgi:hypothetical protein
LGADGVSSSAPVNMAAARKVMNPRLGTAVGPNPDSLEFWRITDSPQKELIERGPAVRKKRAHVLYSFYTAQPFTIPQTT